MAKSLLRKPSAGLCALLVLLVASSCCEAQTTSIIETVTKYRFWWSDQDFKFRGDNRTADPVPDHGVVVDRPRLSKHSAVMDNNERLVVFGGESFNPLNPDLPLRDATNALYLYDFERDHWYTESVPNGNDALAGQIPLPRLDHAGWDWTVGPDPYHDRWVYIHGGVDSQTFDDVWRYQNRTWQKMTWTIPKRYGHCIIAIDDGTAVMLGGRDSEGGYTNTFTKIWSNGTQVEYDTFNRGPTPRAYHSCMKIHNVLAGEGELWVFGGTDGDKVLRDLWKYSFRDNVWSLVNEGKSNEHRSYDGTILPSVTIEGHVRGDCTANFPVINCVGQNDAGTRLVQSFDVTLNRWFRNFWYEPNPLPGLQGHRVVARTVKFELSLYVVGGASGVPLKFLHPKTMFRTRFHMDPCPIGTVNYDLDGKCYQCAPGYSTFILENPHECRLCTEGTYSGTSACVDCPLGTYLPFNGSANASSCLACPGGSFTVNTGSKKLSDCVSCEIGTFADAGGCPPCPAGTYGSSAGGLAMDTGCSPCPYGTWSEPGALVCTDCPAGTSGGPFIERTYPYKLYVHSAGRVSGTSSSVPSACSDQNAAGTLLDEVHAGEWFWVNVQMRDVGQDATLRDDLADAGFSYRPIRLNYLAQGTAPSPNPAVSIRFRTEDTTELSTSQLYYDCNNNNLPNTCTGYGINVTSPTRTQARGWDYQSNCNNNWNEVHSWIFRLRFDQAMPWSLLTIEADGMRPAEFNVTVLGGFAGSPVLQPNPTAYAGYIPDGSLRVFANDLVGNFDPTATWTFDLNTRCTGTGSTVALFDIDGAGAFRSSHTNLAFTDGIWTGEIRTSNDASDCEFYTTHQQGGVVTIPSTHANFQTKRTVALHTTLGSVNITNMGVMTVRVELRNAVDEVVIGDSHSWIRAEISQWRLYHYGRVLIDPNSPTSTMVKAKEGVAIFKLRLFYSEPFNQTEPEYPVKLRFTYDNPITDINFPSGSLPTVETDQFHLWPTNGTVLRLVTDRYAYPTEIRANSSITLEIEAISETTQILEAARQVVPIAIELAPTCPGTMAIQVNQSEPFRYAGRKIYTDMLLGRKVIKLFLQGGDGRGCQFHIFETVPSHSQYTGIWTDPFDIVTPDYVRADLAICSPHDPAADCPTNCEIEVGAITEVEVTVYSTDQVAMTSDSTTVVKFVSAGNESAAIEVDGNGEQRVVNGKAKFRIQILGSDNPIRFTFQAGYWDQSTQYNVTYYSYPTFFSTVESLGQQRLFVNQAGIRDEWTCEIRLLVTATQIRLTDRFRVPTWVPSLDEFWMHIEATNIFGVKDTAWNHPVSLTIRNCHTGLWQDYSWTIKLFDQSTTNYAGATALGSFLSGEGAFAATGDYTHQTGFNDGMEDCSFVLTSDDGALPTPKTLTPLIIEGFDIRKIFPFCTMCEPGQWSEGGNGRAASVPNSPGGCIGCMVGTFSSISGSNSESNCEVCPGGNTGYNPWYWADNRLRESRTDCANGFTCEGFSTGLAGGGGCPAGSIATVSTTNGRDLRHGSHGTIGRRCNLGGCQSAFSCPGGQWVLRCTTGGYTTQALCEDYRFEGLCTWVGTSPLIGSCTFTTDPGTQAAVCARCPPGTYKWWWSTGGIGQCANCEPGGWSENFGHTSVDTQDTLLTEYRCGGERIWDRRCTGTGTGQCTNGTYSKTWGASSSDTCLPCPKGYVCHQLQTYRRNQVVTGCDGVDMNGYMKNPRCPAGLNNQPQNDIYNCPLFPHVIRGAFNIIPCPTGTYSDSEGLWDVSQCLTCPAGYECPPGSTEPTYVDTKNSETDLAGETTPSHVSFDSHNDKLDCASETTVASSDFEGYVMDGHFNEFRRKWTRWTESGANAIDTEEVMSGYKQWWWGGYPSTTDRNGDVTSGSQRLDNVSGQVSWQAIWVNHETVLDMVARVWIYNNFTYRNFTYLDYVSDERKEELRLGVGDQRYEPFAGFELEVYSTPHWSNSSVKYSVSLEKEFTAKPFIEPGWHLLETPVSPGFPVKYATFNLTVRGWWVGYALFDDASLRPSGARICNCSSGFYHNESEPSSRKCIRCPPGFGCSGGHLVRCENSWSVSASTGCHHCREGWLCDADGRGRLIPCEPYTKLDSDTQTCSPCPMGHSCRDGKEYVCNNGYYGDGGLDCIVCEPGYYSPDSGQPEIQCQRCPPGLMSNPGRNGCIPCEPEHHSVDGKECTQCPAGEYIQQGRQRNCKSCETPFIDYYNHTVGRNAQGTAIRVVPRSCLCPEMFDFEVERVEHVANSNLGEVQINKETPSVLYLPGSQLGTHKFRVFVTAGYQKQEQYADVGVEIVNRAPIAQDDEISTTHPVVAITYNLTFLLFNDYDLDNDVLYFASASFTGAQYGATNIVISPNRRVMTVDLPVGFLGPIPISYTIMDKFHDNAADCNAPDCYQSNTATVTLVSKQQPPTAVDDSYAVANGKVDSLDVLVNDFDLDGDELRIVSVTTSNFGSTPNIKYSCPQTTTCGTQTCIGIGSLGAGCTCSTSVAADRYKCYPDNGQEMFVDYTALAESCGVDTFTYTVETNEGVQSTASVQVKITNCYCANHNPGVDLIFLLDTTVDDNDYGWQLAFLDAIQQRSVGGAADGTFYYGAYDVGHNTELAALSTTQIDIQRIGRLSDDRIVAYELGKGLRAAANMKQTQGNAGRRTVYIVMSSRDNQDDEIAFGLSEIAVSGPMVRHYRFGDPSQTVWDNLNTDYEFNVPLARSLTDDLGVLASGAMDDICGWQN